MFTGRQFLKISDRRRSTKMRLLLAASTQNRENPASCCLLAERNTCLPSSTLRLKSRDCRSERNHLGSLNIRIKETFLIPQGQNSLSRVLSEPHFMVGDKSSFKIAQRSSRGVRVTIEEYPKLPRKPISSFGVQVTT